MITLRLTQLDGSPIMVGLNDNFVAIPYEVDGRTCTQIRLSDNGFVVVKETYEEVTHIIEQKNIKR